MDQKMERTETEGLSVVMGEELGCEYCGDTVRKCVLFKKPRTPCEAKKALGES